MKTIKNGIYTYVPTKEIEVSQNKRVYKCYLEGEFLGYRVKTRAKQLIKGVEKAKGFQFRPCKKVYQDVNGNLRFILC